MVESVQRPAGIAAGIPQDGGETGALIRAHDWATTPLGPASAWPERLRAVVDLVLASGFPMVALWGPDLVQLYNDGYAEIMGGRHPAGLGQPTRACWPEVWHINEPIYERVRTGEALTFEDALYPIARGGRLEDAWFTLSYSPLRDEAGAVAGILVTVVETTGRVRAEARLRESERRLRAVLEQGPLAIAVTGPTGEIAFRNAEFDRLWGRPAHDTTAETYSVAYEGYRLDGRPGASEAWPGARAVLAGEVVDGEVLEVVHQSGRRVACSFNAGPIRDEAGHISGAVVMFRDVTEERRMQAALDRLGEERFRAIVETARDYAIFTTDAEDRIDTWPPGAEAVFGWIAAEAIGQPYHVTFTPEDRAAGVPEAELRTARETGQSPNVRWHLRKDGSRVFIEGIVRPLTGPDGAVTGYVKVGQDVTERRATEEALRDSEARLRELNADLERQVTERALARGRTWALSPEIMGVANAEGFFEQSNPAWAAVLGWSEEEVASAPFLDFVHPDDLARTQDAWVAAIERGEPALRFENRYRTKDGGWRWLSWVAVPDIGKVYCSARDVSAEKDQAEALAQAEEQLRQAQKMEAMGQLTGGVAHDFNNLLAPIIGSLDRLVTRGVGSERERRLLAGALESAERARVLVQRLLAFARRQPLQATAVDVGGLVRGMAGLVGSTLGPHVDVRVDLAPDLPPARADANQLEMALLNLAVNARDAMPGGGRLTISASRESVRARDRSRPGLKAGHYVRLAVADTGTGMDEATRARAVEPFFSTKGIGRGTGLGLSMVHGLAAQLGGGLTIDSAPGQGTTVALWLPLSAGPVSEVDGRRPVVAAVVPRGRALLVDDEELVRMSTADMLADLGFDVLEAGAAEEALRLLRDGTAVDLLVTDHMMPGMSGADLAHAVRSTRPGLPVLIVSGYAEVDGLAPDLPRLVKPFRAAELAERVDALMPRAGSAG